MMGKLTASDRAAMATWATPAPGYSWWQRAGIGLIGVVVIAVSAAVGDSGAILGGMGPGSLRARIRRVRGGRPATLILWRIGKGIGNPVGPASVRVRSDLICRFTSPDYSVDLRDSELLAIETYSGQSNRFEPIPTTAKIARVRTQAGPEAFIGDIGDLAVLGVLCGWPNPVAVDRPVDGG